MDKSSGRTGPQEGLADARHGRRPRFATRHSLTVRITHWVNALVLALMLMSGLQIFNAHPMLYWGERSDPGSAWLAIQGRSAADGLRGVTHVLGRDFDTTGVLGASREHGAWRVRAFPVWATIPGPRWLAMGRRWHFFFAWLFVLNGLAYLAHALASGHLRRDLAPRGRELRRLPASLRDHLSPRRLRAHAVAGYNALQKLSYLAVLLLLAPLVVLTGLAMSPWLDSAAPWLPAAFGGRQAARSVHFIAAFSLLLFVFVHIAMVLLVGPWRHLRAMITGRLAAPVRAAQPRPGRT